MIPVSQASHGVITSGDLRAAGYSRSGLSRLVRKGLLQRMHHGVYHIGLDPTWKSHLMAAVLAAGRGGVLSHTSAAMALGILPRETQRRIHVTIPASRMVNRPGIQIHRVDIATVDRTEWERIPITTPARTLADLAGVLSLVPFEQVVSRAIRRGIVRRSALRKAAQRRRSRNGQANLRHILGQEGGPALTRSRAESLLLEHLRRTDLPLPKTNARIEQWEADFLWRDAGLVVEVDGFAYHSSRKAFEQDRRKDQWLESRGFRVLRFTWRQIRDRPFRTVAAIAQALSHGRAGGDGEV